MDPKNSAIDYSLIFDSIPGSFLVLSPKLILVAMSDELAEATLIHKSEAIGRYIFDVLPDDAKNPDGYNIWRASLEKVLRTKRPDKMPLVKYSVLRPGPDGGFVEKFWDPSNYPVFGANGEISYIIHRTQEVTELEASRKQNEAALIKAQDAESRMAFALEAAGMGDWELDLVTGKAYRSLKHDQCFGYRELQASWTLEDALKHIHPEDREKIRQAHLDAVTGENDMSFETRVIWDDGSLHWISARARVERDLKGKPIRMAGLVWDITETKRRTEEIKENENRFRQFADSMTQLAWIARPDGHIYWYNRRWYEHTGTNLEEMQGWGWGKVHHPDHINRVVAYVQKAWMSPVPFEMTFPLRGKSGEYRWFLTRAVPIKNSAGEIVQWVGTNTDIHEFRETQERLQESEDRLQIALKGSKMGTWHIMFPSMSVKISPDAALILGYSDYDVILDQAMEKCIHPEDLEHVHSVLSAALTNGQFYDDEYRILKSNGEVRWINSRGQAKYDGNKNLVSMTGIMLDITDRKVIEQKLREALVIRDDFLSIASHELKTPLTSLKLQSQLLRRQLSKGQVEINYKEKTDLYAKRVESFVNRLDRLVDDMLDISRIRTGKLTMRCQEVDLVAIAKNVVDQMQDAYFATSGEKIKGDFNKVALGNFDPMRIEQVITNLLQNALKYGKGMNVEVQIKDSDDWLILTVKDNGMGISVDDQKKIFERYERAISQSEVSGMGLGLFISDQIIQAHKGKLSVSSQLGEGATFKLEIPKKGPGA